MAKDPAVLFYTSDFLSGTSFFTDEQRGQYIRLLCEQHQLGSIPKNHMITICKSVDNPVIKKFVQNPDGSYYNIRMRQEHEKRLKYCDSRSNNKSGRPKGSLKNKSYDSSMIIHMENENENRNDNKDSKINPGVKSCITHFFNKHQDVVGAKYHVDGGKDGTIMKGLLSTFTANELKSKIDTFFTSPSDFTKQAGFTIGVFKSQINKLGNESKSKIMEGF